MELQGVILKVYATGAKDWASVQVKLNDGSRTIAAGVIPAPTEGFPIIMNGEYVNDPKYGRQFKARSSIVREEITSDGIKKFLYDCITGIGAKKADAVVDAFGKDTIRILKEDPGKLLGIPGIGKANIIKIEKSLEENKPFLDIFLLTNGGITFSQAKKILKEYGDKAISILQKDPFRLMYDIDGFGYKKVDKIACALGIKPDSKERVQATIYYVLNEAAGNEGHVFLPVKEMQKRVLKLLVGDIPDERHMKYFERLIPYFGRGKDVIDGIFKGRDFPHDAEFYRYAVSCDHYTGIIAEAIASGMEEKHLALDEENIYQYSLYSAEKYCADAIGRLLSRKKIKMPGLNKRMSRIQKETDYNREQMMGIYHGLTNRISVITGGPGRGKTTVIKEIIRVWEDSGRNRRVILLAPTGRASQRMAEAAGEQASTIHMFRLKLQTEAEYAGEDDLVIIDECSMIDIQLAATCFHLFQGCAGIIFVGDADQLASIGAGKFLKDMIKCGRIPVTKLVKCYRNEGSIVKNSILINEGRSVSSLIEDEAFRIVEAEKDQMVASLIAEYDRILSIKENGKRKYNIADIGVFSPTNSVSTSSVAILNKALRDKYNPGTKENASRKWRVGDRVMQTKNNYKQLTDRGYGIFNGDTGQIINAVKDPFAEKEDEAFRYTVLFDDGRRMNVSEAEMGDMTLAYAMTIHKSQGSEYPQIIIALNTDHYIMLERNLLYTAETRAKDGVTLIGSKKAVGIAMRTAPSGHRNSALAEKIRGTG